MTYNECENERTQKKEMEKCNWYKKVKKTLTIQGNKSESKVKSISAILNNWQGEVNKKISNFFLSK